MKQLRTIVLSLLILLCLTTCSDKKTVVESYADGPYISNTVDSISIMFQHRDYRFDSLLTAGLLTDDVLFKCVFDSIDCPPLCFSLYPKYDDEENTFQMPHKILVVSDIEGDYERYYKALISCNVIDENYNWTFGEGHLVVLGDLVDRGDYVTQCLWLTYHLEEKAREHGGKVHYLLGNHEQLVLVGYDIYCAPKYHKNFDIMKTNVADLFSSNTVLGSWIRHKNSIVKIGDLMFVHGGISPSLLKYNLSIDQINSEIRRDIATRKFLTDESKPLLTVEGVLWYRGMIEADDTYEKITEPELDEILTFFDCKSIVIGHTPVENISTDFSGKVIRVNVMYDEHNTVLYIEGGKNYIIDDEGHRSEL